MISQSATEQKKLSNIIVAGVVFTVLSVLVATLWGLYTYKQVLDMRAEYAMLKDSVAGLRNATANVVTPPTEVAATPATQPAEKKVSEQPAQAVKEAAVPAMAKAEPKIVPAPPKKAAVPSVTTKKEEEPQIAPTKGVVIWYYYRQGDNASLQSALTTLGYVFQLKTLEKNTGYQKSNCIWFGSGVPVAAVKKVAIAMIQSGTTLKGIRRFPQSRKKPSYKANVIEVGMDINLENYSSRPMSVVEVERAKSF